MTGSSCPAATTGFRAGRHGIALIGSTLYSSFPPCYRCAAAIVQAGIIRVVYPDVAVKPHHEAALKLALGRSIFAEAGVAVDTI